MFCNLVRSIPEAVSCMDVELHRMLIQPVPPARQTDEIGRPLPGSSLINEHPDLPNYRRVADIRRGLCAEVGIRWPLNILTRWPNFWHFIQPLLGCGLSACLRKWNVTRRCIFLRRTPCYFLRPDIWKEEGRIRYKPFQRAAFRRPNF